MHAESNTAASSLGPSIPVSHSRCHCGANVAQFPLDSAAAARPCLIPAGVFLLKYDAPTFGDPTILRPGLCDTNWHALDLAAIKEYYDDEFKAHFEVVQLMEDLVGLGLICVSERIHVTHESIYLRACKCLRQLLLCLAVNTELWTCSDTQPSHPSMLIPQEDNRTMAEIYSSLASPIIGTWQDVPHPDDRLIHNIAEHGSITGLRSTLYQYQRRTVAAMLAQEIRPGLSPSPLYLTLHGPEDLCFHLQPTTMEVLLECPTTPKIRGGVLCEELGTGKTIVVLALVLATRYQLPLRSQSNVKKPAQNKFSRELHKLQDPCSVLTPLALRHFPARFFALARGTDRPAHSSFPSLVEHMIHFVRTTKHQTTVSCLGLHERLQRDYHHLLEQLQLTVPFEPAASLKRNTTSDSKLRNDEEIRAPHPLLLTTATLIVIPPNLFNQWKSEINKHCDTASLRVCAVGEKGSLPSAHDLATSYDIVLIVQRRFADEDKKKNLELLRRPALCTCPPCSDSRIPKCTCISRGHPSVSPLFQLRWKCVVIDEGHVLANRGTAMSDLTQSLNVERRWIVTGTPTTHLLGLKLGSAGQEPVVEQEEDADTPRRWTEADVEDLRKLGGMLGRILQVPIFSDHSKAFENLVRAPLRTPGGPQPGSIRILEQVMQMAMIRHRIEDVEKEIQLQPVHHEHILLDLATFARKSYNVMQAIFVSNAVDSQRKGRDYMFHPASVAYLRLAIDQVTQIMFWGASEELFGATDTVNDIDEQITKARRRLAVVRDGPTQNALVNEEDVTALEHAKKHLKDALDDPEWIAAMRGQGELPFRVRGLPKALQHTWSRFPSAHAATKPTEVWTHADLLSHLRELALQRPLAAEEALNTWGTLFERLHSIGAQLQGIYDRLRKGASTRRKCDSEEVFERATQAVRRRRKRRDQLVQAGGPEMEDPEADYEAASEVDSDGPETEDVEAEDAEPEIAEVARPARRQDMQAEQERLVAAKNAIILQLEAANAPIAPSDNKTSHNAGTASHISRLLARGPLAGVQLGPSASSKLDFILREVLAHAAHEKFLIFSSMPLTLAHVKEGLELAGVPALEFSARIDARVREQLVTTFETSDTFRVFLMELKHGARGLNLTSASRVIFCEPVWQPDVESQAIKRVHRIGQTRPVTVKTLAIRGTAEEMMLLQRAVLKGTAPAAANWMEQNELRRFVEYPRFLEATPADSTPLQFPLIAGIERSTSEAEATGVATSTHDPEGPSPHKKPRRVVHF